MHANFDACLALTLRFEGGYSDNPADPGGATNFGITRATLAKARGRTVAKAEVQALSLAEAAAIYRKSYWDRVAGDSLPLGIDCIMFDEAVNSGPGRAIASLRKLLGLAAAPTIDAAALAAIAASAPGDIIKQFSAVRLSFLERLATFRIFGRGWKSRVLAIEAAALRQAASTSSHPASAPEGQPGQTPGPFKKGHTMDQTAPPLADASKPFWASQTVWSAIAVIGSSAVGGFIAFQSGNLAGFATALTALFGGVTAIVGRFRATTTIQ